MFEGLFVYGIFAYCCFYSWLVGLVYCFIAYVVWLMDAVLYLFIWGCFTAGLFCVWWVFCLCVMCLTGCLGVGVLFVLGYLVRYMVLGCCFNFGLECFCCFEVVYYSFVNCLIVIRLVILEFVLGMCFCLFNILVGSLTYFIDVAWMFLGCWWLLNFVVRYDLNVVSLLFHVL